MKIISLPFNFNYFIKIDLYDNIQNGFIKFCESICKLSWNFKFKLMFYYFNNLI